MEALRELIKDTQAFYADEMERHGYGRKTFALETDKTGEPVVHHIDGEFPEEHYYKTDSGSKVRIEISDNFDIVEAYLFHCDRPQLRGLTVDIQGAEKPLSLL